MNLNSRGRGRLQLFQTPALANRRPVVSGVRQFSRRAVHVRNHRLNSSKSARAVGDGFGQGGQYASTHNFVFRSHVKNQKYRLESRLKYRGIEGDENIWQIVFACYNRRLYYVRIQYDATNHPDRPEVIARVTSRRGEGR
jgi:hypothetical protein